MLVPGVVHSFQGTVILKMMIMITMTMTRERMSMRRSTIPERHHKAVVDVNKGKA